MTDTRDTRTSTHPVSEAPGAYRVLTMATLGFTLMFAAWMMFGVLGISIQEEFGLTDVQLSLISSVAILNGSLWRLPAGIITDRIGGRIVMTVLLVLSAIFSFLVSLADSYSMLLGLAFAVGLAGNSFSVGTPWVAAWFSNKRNGFAMGVFGAGNVGASVTKFIGPVLIAATTGSLYFGGVIEGGWRLIPVIYAGALLITAVLLWFLTPSQDKRPGQGRKLSEMLEPLKEGRVWRFSLYYVAVFGAYVALSSWMPKYYIDMYGISTSTAALLTALFIFPASLMRPVGGSLSDRFGARQTTVFALVVMLIASGILALPITINIVVFTLFLFALGVGMGIGKASVFKYIPDYFPGNVGSVGGLVGMFGGLGGAFLPPLFAGVKNATGLDQATFLVIFVLVAFCLAWLLRAITLMKRTSPDPLWRRFGI
ncbi:putative nitrate transporter NarT [Corynebacterium faecale]|uniref:MFS transporter n=1 Tax=Corynebacterium faecale TaxID=1758466 RepID=UPI0025B3AB14|nr:nitrate/nitrite transporter [Corynebacterium faecale]WJY92081.1 putative nitrate transporter NarT [Corynebacterium faecale]